MARTNRTNKKDAVFFQELATGSTITAAAETAGYTRQRVYEWRDKDPNFAAQWADADAQAIERMEAEADRRALEGVPEPVFYQGIEVGKVQRYSDTLLMFRLKRKDPRYRESYREDPADAVREGAAAIAEAFKSMAAADGDE